jgi:apolipoprotein N-acyltransferase
LSSIIRYDGTVTAQAGQFEQAILRGAVQPTSGTTLFVRVGNSLVLGICLLSLGVALAWPAFQRRRR